MRRRLIRSVLPLLFCAVPPLAAGLIVASLPFEARDFYRRKYTPLDGFIICLGTALFGVQTLMAWRALRWRGRNFDERPDRWLSNLTQAAEWFPLLGLIGTVAGIMQTFALFGNNNQPVSQSEVIERYASAITATCSGLLMALINLLPGWMVNMGRDLIRTLAGGPPPPPDEGSDERPPQRGAANRRTG